MSTAVRISRCSGPGYTSTGCLFLFPRPERERGEEKMVNSAVVLSPQPLSCNNRD